MLTAIEFIAVEAVIIREDRLLRRLGIEQGCERGCEQGFEQCFELLDFLGELLVLFFELLNDFRQLSNSFRLLRAFFKSRGSVSDVAASGMTNG